jgi:hypothetical protein
MVLPFAPVGAEYSGGGGGVGLMTRAPPQGPEATFGGKTPTWGAELIIELDRTVYVMGNKQAWQAQTNTKPHESKRYFPT